MNIFTINSTSVLSRGMRCIDAMLVVAFMMPAIAFSQPHNNPSPVPLGTAANFRILAATAITIGSRTTVTGDVGESPGTTVTNNGGTVTGAIHLNDAAAIQAQSDLTAAYHDAATRTGATPIASELGGTALGAGVYSAGTFAIDGTLTLNGNATDVFIFQAGSTLITADNSSVVLNGVLWSNIFWQVGSTATLGGSSVFEGTILALTTITAGDGATVNGRLLAKTTVTLGSDDVSLPVEAMSFKAVANYGSVTLSWQTQSEVNNAGFNVLRQDPGTTSPQAGSSTFRLVSSYTSNNNLKGMGTSTTGRSYEFADATVQSGMTYQYKIQSVSTNGTTKDLSTLSVTVDVPKNYALYQNYPNPFNPSTTIQFDLKQPSTVTLAIYNVIGQKVLEENYGTMNAGRYNEDINLDAFASGVYFYRIMAIGNSAQGGSASGGDGQRFVSIKKLVLMK